MSERTTWPATAQTTDHKLLRMPQVVSTAEAAGRVAVLPSLADVQGRDFDTPHILIAERVGGMEDIPVSLGRESGSWAAAWCVLAAVSRHGCGSAVHPRLSGTPHIRGQEQHSKRRRRHVQARLAHDHQGALGCLLLSTAASCHALPANRLFMPLRVARQRGRTTVSPATKCNWRVQVGVTAVLTASPTDVLSHVAIRARSQGVLLATCVDEAQLETLKVDAVNPRVQALEYFAGHVLLATTLTRRSLRHSTFECWQLVRCQLRRPLQMHCVGAASPCRP